MSLDTEQLRRWRLVLGKDSQEALGAMGVQTLVVSPTGPEPVRFLEEVLGPLAPKLAAIP